MLPEECYDYRYQNSIAKILFSCDYCGEGMVEGEDYYNIKDDIVCEKCMKDYMKECRRIVGEN